MAATRNKNTQGNYCLDQRQNTAIESWHLYSHGATGEAVQTHWAGNGLNPGQLPWNALSYNPVDIETFLFGIHSTDLTASSSIPSYQSRDSMGFTPELKCLATAHLYATPSIVMPVPQTIPKNQRPSLH